MNLLRLHALAFADAVRRLVAQPWATFFSLLVLALAFTLPILAAIAMRTVASATDGLDTDPHVNVFLALDAGEEDVKRIEQALKSTPGVANVRFISKGEAFDELRNTTHLAEILATFERNPLPHAFAVRLDPAALPQATSLREGWAKLPKVDQVTADLDWARQLAGWIRFGRTLLALVAGALGLAVAFIVGHLIRLQALTRRAEIEVSQLIGATAADVRRPLVYHGVLQGILAGLAGTVLAAAFAAWTASQVRVLAPVYATELKMVFLTPMEVGAIILGAGLLGFAGAWIAAQREIRRFAAAGSRNLLPA